jgi:hypothetical protein
MTALKDKDELLWAAETLEAWNRERNPFVDDSPQLRSDLGNSAAAFRAAHAALAALRSLCGEVYQVVGALSHAAGQNATAVLDNLDAACRGKAIPHDTLLPYTIAPLAGVDAGDEELARVLQELYNNRVCWHEAVQTAAARLRALSARVAECEANAGRWEQRALVAEHAHALSPPAKED